MKDAGIKVGMDSGTTTNMHTSNSERSPSAMDNSINDDLGHEKQDK